MYTFQIYCTVYLVFISIKSAGENNTLLVFVRQPCYLPLRPTHRGHVNPPTMKEV